MSQVLMQLESSIVPGLRLKWSSDGRKALVTYELDGHVSTRGVAAKDLPRPPE